MKKRIRLWICMLCLLTVNLSVPARPYGAEAISSAEVEELVKEIRAHYNNPEEWDTHIAIDAGENGWEYQQEYYFTHGRLYFAFLYREGEEHRFYFDSERQVMIRVIDENGDIYDYGDLEHFDDWEARIMESAYTAYYGPEWFENPVFEGEDGSLDGEWDPSFSLIEEETGESMLYMEGDPMAYPLKAVYSSPESDIRYVLSMEAPGGSFFVMRMNGEGEYLEGERLAWKQGEDIWYFVGGVGEDHTYLALRFSEDYNTLFFNDGFGKEQVFTADPEYRDSDLCALARLYYLSRHGGEVPEYVEVDSRDQDTALIHLYDVVEDGPGLAHTATGDWYTVNLKTLESEDILGNIFTLNVLE